MASNYQAYGTITQNNVETEAVACRGWVTLSAHYDSGSGTLTWEFKGPDGVWRSIYGGTDGTTEQAFTDSHMVNVFFGGDVLVRVAVTLATNPQIDWQVIGNVANRG